MSYRLLRTETADEQLRDIVLYVADISGSPDVALRLIDRIEEATRRLEEFPYSGTTPRWGSLARRGYRMLVVGEYLVFYKVDDEAQTVTIHAVLYARGEYWKFL